MRVSSGSLGYEANARPDAETVKRLGENAKMQGVVWQMWVPEAGIRFGDRCVRLPLSIALPSRALPRPELIPGPHPRARRRKFWILLAFVGTLHAINTYRDKQRAVEPDMPPGALRRLPGGKLLMVDGSTQKEEEQTEHSHRLHQLKDVGEKELALDRIWRYVKESV